MAVEGEIARAAEIEHLFAVEDRLRTRGALHDEAAGRSGGLAEGRLVIIAEKAAERMVQGEQAGQGFDQELAPAGSFDGRLTGAVGGSHVRTFVHHFSWNTKV